MNNYFFNFISRFKGPNLFGASAYSNPADLAKVPEINFIALYNPTWADEKDELLESLLKQILFLETPGSNDELSLDEDQIARRKAEQLNIVGLLRGSCSLARQFGDPAKTVKILVAGAAIVVVEIEKDYELACLVALPPGLAERHEAITSQIEAMVWQAHRTFKLLNQPFERLRELLGDAEFSSRLAGFWSQFMTNFNEASRGQYGPRALGWPNRVNHRGLFLLLPGNPYRKSSVKVPDSLQTDLEGLIRDFCVQPTGYFVTNLNKAMPKKSGLIYMKLDRTDEAIEKSSVVNLLNLLEFLDYQGELVTERLSKRNMLADLFSLLDTASIELLDEDDASQVLAALTLNPVAAIEMLHPANLTNNLVILPLSSTVNGIRSLGLAVNEQLPAPPTWWGFRPFGAPAEVEQPENDDDEVASHDELGSFIIGVNGDETLTRLLVYLPTTTGDSTEIREYLLVLYCHDQLLQGFLFDSSLEQLSHKSFYEELKWDVCEQTMEIFQECFLISSGGIGLNTSISSLPNPLKTIISGKQPEASTPLYEDVDSDFFFIIFDTQDHSYQSSLPDLPSTVPSVDGEVLKLAISLNNAIFHLHDQLADHFVVKSAGRVFTPLSVVNEHLHKFSSNKSNNWLFYSIRHKNKTIIIIRNYSTKHKKNAKAIVPSQPENSEGFLSNLAGSVQDYANLGFLDTLGEDVKVWLGRSDA